MGGGNRVAELPGGTLKAVGRGGVGKRQKSYPPWSMQLEAIVRI